MNSRVALAILFLVAVLPVTAATQPDTAVNPQSAIQEVLSGRRSVADADWWGFDPTDATKALQPAILSKAKTVRVRKMSGPWIVDKIDLVSDQELIFEPGVVVLAKKGSFRGSGDSLFTAASRKNIRLTGPGAILRMRRMDYDASPYRKAEWRHVLNLRSCTNVTVTGLTLAESGGDGIYLGVDRSGGPNQDIVIRDVICDRNYRQGISVISAENLSIEDCVLRYTAGTAPAAGIDFEPNLPGERLANCVMRHCLSENNQGLGYHFYLGNLAPTSAPISIRVEDCISRGTNRQSLNVYLPMNNRTGAVPGQIDFIHCRFEDQGRAGLTISKPAVGARLRFENCRLADPAPPATGEAPILLRARPGAKLKLGGVEFLNFVVEEKSRRPLLDFQSGAGVPLANVSGELIRRFDGQTERLVLDDAWLAKVSPPDPFFDLPTVAVNLATLRVPASWSKSGPLPAHRLRGLAHLSLSAKVNDRVRLVLRFQAVGRATESKPLSATVTGPSGQRIRRVTARLGEEVVCEFTAAESGFYDMRCDAGRHTVTVISSNHPLCLLGEDGSFHFIRTAATLSFFVPAGTGQFGVRITGGGGEELVKATLLDPAGRQVWHEDAVGQPRCFVADGSSPGQIGQWRLRLEKPTRGVFEDHYVELRGVPAVLFFNADTPSEPKEP